MLVTFSEFSDAYPLRFTRRLTLRRTPHFIDPKQLALFHGNALIALMRRSDACAFTKLYDANPQLQLRVTDTFLSSNRSELYGRVDAMRYTAAHLLRPAPQSNT